jgi:hypothetical protein
MHASTRTSGIQAKRIREGPVDHGKSSETSPHTLSAALLSCKDRCFSRAFMTGQHSGNIRRGMS